MAMKNDVTRSFPQRLMAAVLLASMTAAAAAPLPAHSSIAEADCHPAPVAAAALSANAAPDACDHTAGTACAAMLGCVVLPSALTSATASLSTPGATTVVTPFANGALHGRLGLGPPTPPPNS